MVVGLVFVLEIYFWSRSRSPPHSTVFVLVLAISWSR